MAQALSLEDARDLSLLGLLSKEGRDTESHGGHRRRLRRFRFPVVWVETRTKNQTTRIQSTRCLISVFHLWARRPAHTWITPVRSNPTSNALMILRVCDQASRCQVDVVSKIPFLTTIHAPMNRNVAP